MFTHPMTLGDVGVRATSAAWSADGVDESAVVLQTTLRSAGGLLLLLLLVHLRRLALDLAGTGERAVHLTTEQSQGDVDVGAAAQALAELLFVVQRAAVVVEDRLLGGGDRLGLLEVLLQRKDDVSRFALHGVGAI